MFIGHFGVGLAAKRFAPKTSLGTLFLSVQLADLLWPMFLLLGLEHVRIEVGNTVVTPLDFYDYPITHSLAGMLAWAVMLGLVYFGLQRYPRGAWVVGAGVLSHWVLDAIAHRPDLLLVPGGSTHVGFCLWNSLPATVIVEGAIFFGGLALYLQSTTARDRTGRYALWALIAFLLVLYVGNLWGPPPPSVNMLAIAGLAMWLFVAWAYWIDDHRECVAHKR
jgi:hypothetical protein